MATELCGCSEVELASRTVEENLEICKTCGILATCGYPQSVALKMVKSDIEEKTNLKKLAQESGNFGEFHDKSHKHNRLYNQPLPVNHHTKQQQPKKKNLQQLAKESMTFSNFHEQTQEGA